MYYILKYIYSFLLITNKPSINKILNKNQDKNILFDHLIKYNKLKNNQNYKENIFENYLIDSFNKLHDKDYNKPTQVFDFNNNIIKKFNPKNIINNIDIYQNYKILLNNLNYNINKNLKKYKFLENILQNNLI